MWFQLNFFPPLSFFTPFSFQTGKSVPRSGSAFPPRVSLPDPGPGSCPGASWWGERREPICSRGRGARGAGPASARHMAAAAQRAPRGAAPSSPEVRRRRPAAPEPGSG